MKQTALAVVVIALIFVGVFFIASMWTPMITATEQDRVWYQENAETRTAQSVEHIIATTDGLTATYTAIITDGIKFTNDGATFLHVKNASASTYTITVVTQLTVNGLAVDDLAVAVGDAQERFIGPFPTTTYNVQSGTDVNMVYVTPSGYDADLSMAILNF